MGASDCDLDLTVNQWDIFTSKNTARMLHQSYRYISNVGEWMPNSSIQLGLQRGNVCENAD